jgi:pantoate--beta-alanine ligase
MTPPLLETIAAVRHAVAAARGRGLTVGLVPTMGALHEGHASLFRVARADSDFVVASIFVNPTQFGPHEDFHRYPRPLKHDLAVCAAERIDAVFHPDVAAMYPKPFHTVVEVAALQDGLCGASRPGHFRGVATVVLKLLNVVRPDVLYLGQKDAQQVRVLRQMVRDLDVDVVVRECPIVRTPDGLALSSRNQYLDAEQRRHATVLYQALEEVRRRVDQGERDATALTRLLAERVAQTPGARLDYAAVVDGATLQPLERLGGEVLVALAVFFGTTRLIDNVILHLPERP